MRVESFEVEVIRVDRNSAGQDAVWFCDGADTSEVGIGTNCVVLAGRCRVLAPPVKVGDVVTEDNIDRLPFGSIVAVPTKYARPLFRNSNGWECGSAGHPDTDPIYWLELGAVVLRIGGGAS